MRAPQIYTKFNQDLLFQIRIGARASKINDMAVRQRRNEQTHPSRDLPGRCAAAAHDRGRKMTGEGGEGRASKAGGRGRPEEREGERRSGAWAGGPMENREESCEGGGGSDMVRAGEIFVVLF